VIGYEKLVTRGRRKKVLIQNRGTGGPPVSYVDSCIFHQSGLVVPILMVWREVKEIREEGLGG
jgi:hypothetical protein